MGIAARNIAQQLAQNELERTGNFSNTGGSSIEVVPEPRTVLQQVPEPPEAPPGEPPCNEPIPNLVPESSQEAEVVVESLSQLRRSQQAPQEPQALDEPGAEAVDMT